MKMKTKLAISFCSFVALALSGCATVGTKPVNAPILPDNIIKNSDTSYSFEVRPGFNHDQTVEVYDNYYVIVGKMQKLKENPWDFTAIVGAYADGHEIRRNPDLDVIVMTRANQQVIFTNLGARYFTKEVGNGGPNTLMAVLDKKTNGIETYGCKITPPDTTVCQKKKMETSKDIFSTFKQHVSVICDSSLVAIKKYILELKDDRGNGVLKPFDPKLTKQMILERRLKLQNSGVDLNNK